MLITPRLSKEAINAILRHAMRFYYAATQDNDPVVRFLHINYAVNDMDILAELANKAEIKDYDILRDKITSEQDSAQMALFNALGRKFPI